MKLNRKTIIKILDSIYDNSVEGLPATPTVEELAEDYLTKNNNKEKAIDSLINWSTAKSSSSGFITSVGGAITLPIAVPTGLTALFYIQMRMIAGIAYISGYDPRTDQVRTLIYSCLVGDSCMNILKEAGIKIGGKLTHKMITSISGQTLATINRLVGFRLVTKFGEKGVINLGRRIIPIVSGVIGGIFDGSTCYISGKIAKKLFFKS